MRLHLFGGPMDGSSVNLNRVSNGLMRRGISSHTYGRIEHRPNNREPYLLTVWDWDDNVPDYIVTYALDAKNNLHFHSIRRAS